MNEPTREDDVDDGPIILPQGAKCALCAYSIVVKVPAPSKIVGQVGTADQRFCRRGPPTPVVIPDGRGSFSIVGQPAPVPDEHVCFEFDPAPLLLGSTNG